MESKNIPWELIIAQLKGEISEADRLQLITWLSDDINQTLFEELQSLWQKIQDKATDYTPDTAYYWKELSARMHATAKPEKAEPTISPKRFQLKALYRYAAVACLVLVSAAWLSYYIGTTVHTSELAEQRFMNLSGKSKIQLPDGTEVWLHSNTTLVYKDDFTNDKRLVSVVGEAYFEVTPDKERPFIVQTQQMNIVVHGTKFNVNAPKEGTESTVSLVEGSISLETATQNQYLKPGETAIYSKENGRLSVAKGDVQFDRLWASNELLLSDETLGDVCRQLSKWYGVTIHLHPSLSNQYRYTFTLRNEPLEEIMRLMSRTNPITYSFDEENVLTIKSKN